MGDAKKTIEIWDIRDQDGNKTGRTIARGEKRNPGDYHLVVHIWIKDDKDRYLIQQRSAHLDDLPNMWTTTGGCIVQGEESQEAVIREMREELGVHISTDELKYVTRWVGADTLTDLWQINKNIAIEEICFTDGEVSQVKWATTSEIKEMIDEGGFLDYGPNYLKIALG